jgi:PTH1 family peptidyl-tRNA hydrolase
MVVRKLVADLAAVAAKTKALAKLWSAKRGGATVLMAEPQTFMNLSGNAVAPLARSKKIAAAKIVVVHDDLDLPLGEVRVSKNASSGGHNGVQSVIDALGTQSFARVRLGIGRSKNIPPEKYVLMRFPREEEAKLPEILAKALAVIENILNQ